MKKFNDIKYFYLFTAPAILGFIIFTAWPMLYSFYLSFTNYDLIHKPQLVGIKNYVYLFTNEPSFWPAVKVTLIYTVVSVPLGIIFALALALLLNTGVKYIGIFRTIYYLPSILPGVASGVLWVWIFNPSSGLLNNILSKAGIAGPAWTASPDWALPALIIMGQWGFGGAMIIFLAGLQDVPGTLYEAASIDGAGWFDKLRHVTFPSISPIILFNLVMGLIGAVKVFDGAFVFSTAAGLVPGGPARSTLFYVLDIYLKAFNYFHMGLASAMAWILFIVIALLTLLNFSLAKKWVHYQ